MSDAPVQFFASLMAWASVVLVPGLFLIALAALIMAAVIGVCVGYRRCRGWAALWFAAWLPNEARVDLMRAVRHLSAEDCNTLVQAAERLRDALIHVSQEHGIGPACALKLSRWYNLSNGMVVRTVGAHGAGVFSARIAGDPIDAGDLTILPDGRVKGYPAVRVVGEVDGSVSDEDLEVAVRSGTVIDRPERDIPTLIEDLAKNDRSAWMMRNSERIALVEFVRDTLNREKAP